MKRAVTAFFLLLAVAALADEEFVVSAPPPRVDDVVARWALIDLRLRGGVLDYEPRVDVRLIGLKPDGGCARDARGDCKILAHAYAGATARQMQDQLNSLDLRTNSLRKRIMARLEADGVLLGGQVIGTPGLPTETPTATPSVTMTMTNTATFTSTPPLPTPTTTPTVPTPTVSPTASDTATPTPVPPTLPPTPTATPSVPA